MSQKIYCKYQGEKCYFRYQISWLQEETQRFQHFLSRSIPLNWIHKPPRENPSCYTTLSLFAFYFAVSQICHGYWLKSHNALKMPALDSQRIFSEIILHSFSMKNEPAQQLHFLLIDISWPETGQCRVDKSILSLTWAPSAFLHWFTQQHLCVNSTAPSFAPVWQFLTKSPTTIISTGSLYSHSSQLANAVPWTTPQISPGVCEAAESHKHRLSYPSCIKAGLSHLQGQTWDWAHFHLVQARSF